MHKYVISVNYTKEFVICQQFLFYNIGKPCVLWLQVTGVSENSQWLQSQAHKFAVFYKLTPQMTCIDCNQPVFLDTPVTCYCFVPITVCPI